MSVVTTLPPPSWLPRNARSNARLSQLWQVPTFLAGVLAFALVAGGAAVRHGRQQEEWDAEVARLRIALQSSPAVETLIPQLEQLVARAARQPARSGQAHFLLACAYLAVADKNAETPAREWRRKALPHLEHAELHGVDPQDRPRLWYLQGKTRLLTGGAPAQAIVYLTRALPRGTDDPAEGYGLLADAYLRLPRPDLEAALAATDKQLKASQKPEVVNAALLARGDLLVRKKQFAEAIRALERISKDAGADIRSRAGLLLARCYEVEHMWEKAAAAWEELLRLGTAAPLPKRQLLFALGNCYHSFSPPDVTRARQTWAATKAEGGEEAQAAALRLADSYLCGEPKDLATAVAELQFAFRNVDSPKAYRNSLIPLQDAGELLAAALRAAREQQAYDQAHHLAALYARIAPAGLSDAVLAEITQDWAENLQRQAAVQDGPAGQEARRQAQARWLTAAQLYEQAAKAAPADKRGDLLWRSARCYREGGDPAQATAMLEQFVRLPQPAEKIAEAWFLLARTREDLGQTDAARQAYLKCIEYPSSPCAAKARYQIALDLSQKGQFAEAEEILRDNLRVSDPEMDREAREQSLFQLAALLYQQKKYSQASIKLQEAVSQYPANSRALLARDMLGDSYRKLAEEAAQRAKNVPSAMLQEGKMIERERRKWLEQAAEVYRGLEAELKEQQSRRQLSDREEKLLRKAAMVAADIQFDLNEFAEALVRYTELASRYRGQIEELYACQRILMTCHALRGQPRHLQVALDAARAVLPSARETLTLLPESFFREASGTWTRAQWLAFFHGADVQLQELAKLAQQP